MEVFLQLLESTVVKEGLCVVSSINTLTCSDSCKSTALENRVTGEKGPETELELGTYALSWSFSHSSHRPRSRSFIHNCPLVLGDEGP